MISKKKQKKKKKGQEEGKKAGLFSKLKNHLGLKYPKKLDFCRLTKTEIDEMLKEIWAVDRKSPSVLKPIVAIGHTKDLKDIDTVDYFLSILNESGVKVTTCRSICEKLIND